MTWSYSAGSGTALDRTRFLCGDTDTLSQMVSNEEITDMLGLYGANIFRAAAAVCRHLSARFSRRADGAIDDMRKSLSQLSAQFAARAKELEAQADSGSDTGTTVPVPYAGGVYVADRDEREADTSLIQPFFTRDLFDPLSRNDTREDLE